MKRVISSTTAAEALAANDALDMMVYIKSVIGELLGQRGNDIPMELTTDCRNLHKSIMNSALVENPRLRTNIAMLKESLKERELSRFELLKGKDMIADVLTKKGSAGINLLSLLRTCKL